MSCENLWSRGSSTCSDNSESCRKPSLGDVISGTIDLAASRATSQHCNRGLNSVNHWPNRPGVITRTSTARHMSLTYDDIVSRSLMANCKNPTLNNVRTRKADELGLYAIYDVVSRSLVVDPIDTSKNLEGLTASTCNDTSKNLKEDNTFDESNNLIKRNLFEHNDSLFTSLIGKNGVDYIKTVLGKNWDVSKVSKRAEESKTDHKPKAPIVLSDPVELKATAELTSIPDFMKASTSTPKVSLSRLRVRKSVTCPVKPNTSRRLKASTPSKGGKAVQGGNRTRGGVGNKTTPTKEPKDDAKDAKVLYVSSSSVPQASNESVNSEANGDETGCAAFSEIHGGKRCDVFTEQFFEMSKEEWNDPEKMFAAMRQWRAQQLRETHSQTPLVERANKYFGGQTFSREDLREFLRRTHSEQMDRIKEAFQGLLVIQDFLDKVNTKEDIDFLELTKELKKSAAKLYPPGGSGTH